MKNKILTPFIIGIIFTLLYFYYVQSDLWRGFLGGLYLGILITYTSTHLNKK